MPRVSYGVQTGAAVALTAATARSILGVRAGSTFGLDLTFRSVSFDGVTATAVPVLCELCRATFATNAPGTASTSVTPVREGGLNIAHGMTAARAWTTEPTVLTVLHEELIPPTSGLLVFRPLGWEYDCDVSEGFVIRCTAPAGVNVRASVDVMRI